MALATFDVPPLRRIVARRTAAWLVCAVVAASWTSAARAQTAGGPIVIPGPGEQNSADLAKMTALATGESGSSPRTQSSSNAAVNGAALRAVAPAATPAATDRFAALANASGAIVIAGPGDASAAAAPRLAVSPQSGPAATAGLMRVNMNQSLAASQVVPVIVSAAPARAASAAALRPVNAAPASGIEIDSLASRGEPPEFGTSPADSSPAPRGITQVALAQAAQRAQAVQLVRPAQVAQVAQVVVAPAASAAQTAAQPTQAAQPVPANEENGETIRAAALDFLKQQAVGLPGRVELSVAPAFPRGLAACATLQPFMPNGARLWGRTTVGVRCASGHPWTVWLQARVSVHATYYVAARALIPGEILSEADLVGRDGDLTMLPQSIITAPSQAVGSVTLLRVNPGLPLRQDMLRNAAQVTAGQMVRVVAQGDGFSISSEGSALSNATPGQPVKVKTATGQILMGIVKDSATVQIQM